MLENVRAGMHLQMQYETLCRRVAEILADADLVRITDENPDPVGEYSGEAAEIVRRIMVALRNPQGVDQELIKSVVVDVFKSEFEVDIASDEAAHIASRIEKVMN